MATKSHGPNRQDWYARDAVPGDGPDFEDKLFEHAACKGEEPSIFFPARKSPALEAKAVCAGCPIRLACLAYAYTYHVDLGVWGGLTENERHQRL